LGQPFEHEARLKELIVRQAALNALLDLDKGAKKWKRNVRRTAAKANTTPWDDPSPLVLPIVAQRSRPGH
jgi:hypothetical protein